MALRIEDGRMDVVPGQLLSSIETFEFNQEIEPDNLSTELADKTHGCFGRSSRCQQIIDD